MDIVIGMRDKLDKHLDVNKEFSLRLQIHGNSIYDCSCFGVDSEGKLSDERYMIFYNQKNSPKGEIKYQEISDGAIFAVNLSYLPSNIQKLVFTVSIDGNGSMRDIVSHTASLTQSNSTVLKMQVSGSDFADEKAVISMEIYIKDSWRFAAVAKGFNGGLGDLLRFFGGEEAGSGPDSGSNFVQASAVKSNKVSLEKKLTDCAPELVSLAKPITLQLEKKKLLDCIARVGLVLDISGSMHRRYSNGTVQEIVNKILPLAVQFDDDGELDLWYYGTTPRRMPSVNMSNYKSAVPKDWKQLMYELGGRNAEPPVMKMVVNEYTKSTLPAYVVFITDGGVSQKRKIKEILTFSSSMPIFWQFVGVGGYNYGILEELDTMTGRYVDNAGFFAIDDFNSVSNEELYNRLLSEFPDWLNEVKNKGMIR